MRLPLLSKYGKDSSLSLGCIQSRQLAPEIVIFDMLLVLDRRQYDIGFA
jgi:hypothetical protein